MDDMSKGLLVRTVFVVLSGGIVGCGGGSNAVMPTALPTPSPRAVVSFNVDPNPVVSEYQGDGWWRFRVNLELYDTGGVGFQINTIRTTVSSAVTGTILLDYNYSVAQHVDARGRTVLQFTSPLYRTVTGGGANVKFVADIRDDMGNAMTLSNQAGVLRVGGPDDDSVN
jgi:hypothetical protein